MTKPRLTVERLIKGGFSEVGCWKLNETGSLHHEIGLPKTAGVYAFAIDGTVHYVGLASKSLAQRLNFYRRPGASQTTNIRLNQIIREVLQGGSTVQVLTASPPDQSWNGLAIKGAEGLEAGIIESFDVPWNIRGASVRNPQQSVQRKTGPRQSGVRNKILQLIRRRPGMTELEIARAIYGPSAQQPQVNPVCRKLVADGYVQRQGEGRSGPFIYYPVPAEE